MFYLGTHQPHWLRLVDVPLFVSRRTLAPYKTLPRARHRWALDSGGFTEITKYGAWQISVAEYINLVRRFRDEVGNMDWAAPMDMMCEEKALKATGLTVRQHQELTRANYLELISRSPDVKWIPVLQGDTEHDYLRHADDYESAGVVLSDQQTVGIGSVCRREATAMVESLITRLSDRGIRLHAFGMKSRGVAGCARSITSADSLAWSYGARKKPPLPGHEARHKNCANCMEYALQWREKVLHAMRVGMTSEAQMELAL